ncbi:hypothetical protein SAMN04515649_1115 [Eubacterium callanderi]|uniref:Oligosaccharide repeat unit polymerase n=2 Tax=Eubacterium callanderi TaxID=53442 RepID=A0AB74F4E5_9FIRM|nr:hypothetical protein [Eubacterium callanderi]OEZ03320.1 hypothetical protein BUME_40330 [[Butyribacterium] methylotrophicum]ADO37675.1 hypothetical protein ELI_2694 [Eubacterium callanderi]MCB6661468.1 hypothetical protein [Eubacterium callanderi]MCB6754561.1 hypothetical protein [Eubacterium callanderi]MCB7106041.1 hypothetical protein [Eubacterium callanderi]
MNIIYIFLVLILLLIIFFRKIDLLSIGAIGLIIYTINCALGEVWIERGTNSYYYYSNINEKLYTIVCFQLIFIMIFITLCDFLKKKYKFLKKIKLKTLHHNIVLSEKSYQILLAISYAFIGTNIVQNGISVFTLSKGDMSLNFFFSLAVVGSLVVFIYALLNNKKKLFFFSIIPLFLTLFIGSRAYVTTAIVVVLVYNWEKIKFSIKTNLKLFVIGGLLLFAILVYKEIYIYVKDFDFNKVASILLNSQTYIDTLSDNAESRVVFSIYNYVITNNFQLSNVDTFARVMSIFPIANDFIDTTLSVRFSTIMMNNVFNTTYGLASNFWAESYAMWGIKGIFLAQFIWMLVLFKCNKYFYMLKNKSCFILTIASYCSFYINRLDYVQVFGMIKSVLFVYFIWIFSYYILDLLYKNKENGKLGNGYY